MASKKTSSARARKPRGTAKPAPQRSRAASRGASARAAAAAAPKPAAGAPPRIARIAKGKKPQYFSDPAIDKLLWMTLTLMEELSVTRDRLDTVERLLAASRVLELRDIERYRPAAAAAAERAARRTAYVDRVMRAAQSELEELTARGMPKSEAEVVAAVEA
jgi:hypothetical protein